MTHSLHYFSLRLIFFSLLTFGLWWFAIPTILSTFALPVGTMTAHWFEREQVTITVNDEGWVVHTKVLLKDQSKVLMLNLKYKALISFIIGFPLLWALLVAMPATINQRLWNLLIGSVFFAIPVILTLFLRIVYFVGELISGDNVGQIFIMEGLYQTVYPYSTETLAILAGWTKLLAYSNFMVFPILISFLLNRQVITDLFKNRMQYHEITT